MKQATIVTIILGILLLITVVQAFQLNSVKKDLVSGQVDVKSTSTSKPTTSTSSGNSRSTGSLPANIKDLPQMVGGC